PAKMPSTRRMGLRKCQRTLPWLEFIDPPVSVRQLLAAVLRDAVSEADVVNDHGARHRAVEHEAHAGDAARIERWRLAPEVGERDRIRLEHDLGETRVALPLDVAATQDVRLERT